MTSVFRVRDKSARIIRLTAERWLHITKEHPNLTDPELIKETLIAPTTIQPSKYDSQRVRYYYRHQKRRRNYVFVAVKYLNGEGFVITAYFVRTL